MRNSFLLGSILTVAVGNAAASAEVIYNSTPSTLNPNYTSQPFQAQQISEFGDRVSFAGSARQLSSASITLSCWARYQDYNVGGQYYGTGAFAGDGFTHSLTLNIYESGSGSLPGAIIASVTQDKFIQYRPTVWASANGIAQNVTFDLSGLGITVPESIVWGLAFNTQSYGAQPIGTAGPYNLLNVCYNQSSAWTPPNGGVTVGSTDTSTLFKNSASLSFYNNPIGGAGTFRMDTTGTSLNGTPLGAPMASFSAVPAPGALALLGVAGLAGGRRRRA